MVVYWTRMALSVWESFGKTKEFHPDHMSKYPKMATLQERPKTSFSFKGSQWNQTFLQVIGGPFIMRFVHNVNGSCCVPLRHESNNLPHFWHLQRVQPHGLDSNKLQDTHMEVV